MSSLTAFRDHCRKMAGPPVAPGCSASAERALWLQMAAEIDEYLARPIESEDLFGDVAQEPEAAESAAAEVRLG